MIIKTGIYLAESKIGEWFSKFDLRRSASVGEVYAIKFSPEDSVYYHRMALDHFSRNLDKSEERDGLLKLVADREEGDNLKDLLLRYNELPQRYDGRDNQVDNAGKNPRRGGFTRRDLTIYGDTDTSDQDARGFVGGIRLRDGSSVPFAKWDDFIHALEGYRIHPRKNQGALYYGHV